MYEIEEIVDGKRRRRPATVAEHGEAAALCRRALESARAERNRLLAEVAKVDAQIEVLEAAVLEHEAEGEP